MDVIHYYTRQGCHLCELMLEELLPLIKGRASVEVRDVDTRPEWLALYDIRVPVVEHGGEFVSGYPLDRSAIDALLARMPENSQ
jgi:hypothetical protein